jgi:transcriptional regulator with XRE-family HTH domain
MNDHAGIGERIAIALKRAGLKQNGLSKRLGLSSNAANRWVRGLRAPSLPDLEKIARETGVDVSWLAFGVGGPNPLIPVREKADGARRAVMQFPAGSQVNVKTLPDGTVEVTIEF